MPLTPQPPYPSYPYFGYPGPDPHYEERLEVSGLKGRIEVLEAILPRCETKTSIEIILNELCAARARVAGIILATDGFRA